MASLNVATYNTSGEQNKITEQYTEQNKINVNSLGL